MVRFLLNNQSVETNLPPATTLADFVRYEANLRGTKIGCREGDCGACTVLVGSPANGKVSYQTYTSCLTPLANVYGKHVVTIEGLNNSSLNPVQEAMVAHSGTQCGFCTPGFVVSLCGYALQSGKDPALADAVSAIDGNICRCTGYKSIERAAAVLTQKLKEKDTGRSLEWLVEQGFVPDSFFTAAEKLAAIPPPGFLEGQLPVGGGTDLYVQRHDELPGLPFLFLQSGKKAGGIRVSENICHVPGDTTVTELMCAEPLVKAIPGWRDYFKLVSSTPIRNMATLAGNLVNASPIGDLTIMMLALDATLTLENVAGRQRAIALREFYRGYKQLNKTDDERVVETSFPLPGKNTFFHFEKVCKRTYLDIASVNTAIGLRVEQGTIVAAHVAIGGVAPVPLYLEKTSALLAGKSLAAGPVKEAAAIMIAEITPIGDVRGSAAYKKLLARQLFFSHFLSLFSDRFQMHDLL